MKDLKFTGYNLPYINQELLKLDKGKEYRLSVSEWKPKRSLSANAQQHKWYAEIASHYGDRDALEVKNYCKDALGLPILFDSPKHSDKIEFLLTKLDYYKHSFESRMKLIQCLEVTSLFTTAESKRYMENMIFHWNNLGVNIQHKDN